jgi:hypothetical protein
MLQRLLAAGFILMTAFALSSGPAYAARANPVTHPKPTAPGQARKTPAQAPEIFQVSPTKVDPTVQPNIMILGQHLTPATTVVVGGRPATTVQAPDANHLLVKLPTNLSGGTYSVEVTNDAGTAVAVDQLVVEQPGASLSTMQMIAIGGFVIFLALVMRLSRIKAG